MKCEACGKTGTLDIRATLIRCSFCDAEWSCVNGFWVESKPPRCMECGGDGRTVEAEPQTCPACAGTGREGGVKGGIETSPPLPLADAPPSPCGSVRGTDAVCMPSVSAEPVARERFLSVYGAAIAVQWFEHVRAGGRLDDDEIRRFIFDARALAEWTEDVQR